MIRSLIILAALAFTAMATAAWAEEFRVVYAEPPPMIDTAPLDKVQRLNAPQKSLLSRAISVGCKQKARHTDEMKTLAAETGGDASGIYCDCMSPFMAQHLSIGMLKSIATTREMPSELMPLAQAQAKQCMQLAAVKP